MKFDLKSTFASELLEISHIINDALFSKEVLVEEIGSYLFDAGGKRIRPIVTLLISHICNYKGNKDLYLAAAVELIHAATLLHDDVVDESNTRRSRPTANFKWGNKASILVGDFLFSQAFKLMVKSESLEALTSLANSSAIIAEGEVMQLARLYENKMLTLDEYELIAKSKTAALFAASAHVGAIIAVQDIETKNAAKNYGEILGLIFQIKDDMLDYFADPQVTGKNIGGDLTQGNITIPIIFAYNSASEIDKKSIEECFFINPNRIESLDYLLDIMKKYDVENQINNYVKNLYQKGQTYIDSLPFSNEYTGYLVDLLNYVSGRNA